MDSTFNRQTVLIYEPRALYRNAVSMFFEQQGYRSRVLSPAGIEDTVATAGGSEQIVIAGVSGAGHEFFTVLRLIYRLTERNVRLAALLPENDVPLACLMHGMGVTSLLCDNLLHRELFSFLSDPGFSSPHLPGKHPVCRGELKRRLSLNDLNFLIECSGGSTVHDIALRRQISYKTVYASKRNIRLRLGLHKPDEWLALISRIEQLCRPGGK